MKKLFLKCNEFTTERTTNMTKQLAKSSLEFYREFESSSSDSDANTDDERAIASSNKRRAPKLRYPPKRQLLNNGKSSSETLRRGNSYRYKTVPRSLRLSFKHKPIDLPTLEPHQLEGVNFLLKNWHSRRNTIVTDDIGLGKMNVSQYKRI